MDLRSKSASLSHLVSLGTTGKLSKFSQQISIQVKLKEIDVCSLNDFSITNSVELHKYPKMKSWKSKWSCITSNAPHFQLPRGMMGHADAQKSHSRYLLHCPSCPPVSSSLEHNSCEVMRGCWYIHYIVDMDQCTAATQSAKHLVQSDAGTRPWSAQQIQLCLASKNSENKSEFAALG